MQMDAQAGAAIYSRPILALYDFGVLKLSNQFVWRCPSSLILDHYNLYVSANHLDVGVGTGYFLDKCRFPASRPRITLFDLNSNSLNMTAQRLRRYDPKTQLGSVLDPLHFDGRFDSIGLNYLLHCLPGTMRSKQIVFEHLKSWLNPGGVIFGTTILGQGIQANRLARRLMKVYNTRGIFNNAEDSLSDLESGLGAHFSNYSTKTGGCVAFFAARM